MATIRVDAKSAPGIIKISVQRDDSAPIQRLEIADHEAGIIAALINEVFADRRARNVAVISQDVWDVTGETGNREAVAE